MIVHSIFSVSRGPHQVLVHTDVCFISRVGAPQCPLRTLSRLSPRLRAVAPQQSAKLPLDAAQAEKYVAISRAFEARLSDLYKKAPDDKQLPTIETEKWDDEELLKEGRELGSAEAAPGKVRCKQCRCVVKWCLKCLSLHLHQQPYTFITHQFPYILLSVYVQQVYFRQHCVGKGCSTAQYTDGLLVFCNVYHQLSPHKCPVNY